MAPSGPAIVRQVSLRAAMEVLLHGGPVSRAEIARRTGLSKQTVSEVVRRLEAAGWVRPLGPARGGIGRAALAYAIEPEAGFVAGVDLGGTRLRAAIANLSGAVRAEAEEATDRRGGGHVLRQIGALTARLVARAGIERARLLTAVVGTPGVVDPVGGTIRMAPNIPGLDRLDVPAGLRDALAMPVTVENDVNVAALGEHWQGAGQGSGHMAFIALGTGIGLGLIADGRLLRGARGGAGEIAWLPLGGDPFDPAARRGGALEGAVGAAGLLRRYPQAGDVKALFDAAAAGRAEAEAVVADTARLLTLAVLSVAALLEPELVVLGGSVGIRPELVAAVQARLPACLPEPPPVRASALGTRAGVVGALALGLNQVINQLFGTGDLPRDLTLPAQVAA